jgi:pantetheine-phosphate adenylyltransferase
MIAIYPGSFDPFTLGHLDIVKRAVKLFTQLHIVIANNENKEHMFRNFERYSLVNDTLHHELDKVDMKRVVVQLHTGYLNEYINNSHANVVVRGVRNYTDWNYEERIEQFVKDTTNADVVYLRPIELLSGINSSSARLLLDLKQYQALDRYLSIHQINMIKDMRR